MHFGPSFRSGQKLNLEMILGAMELRTWLLSEIASEYLELRSIDPKPTMVAVEALSSIAGDRKIETYTRDDAKVSVVRIFGTKSGVR